ncbi:MAG: hypothetical protein JOZ96_13995 [Acidobacteria bacterium]|nr:hypothetical protein [Acidobacteriota bacterium]
MTGKKGWGSTVAGWFIERDEEPAGQQAEGPSGAPGDASVDDLLARYGSGGEGAGAAPRPADPAAVAPYTTPSPTQGVFQTTPPPATGGQVDFDAVFAAAGVNDEERQRVGKTVELLRSLPAGTDAAVKKQIVEASLKAFGVPIEQIIEAGVEEIQALDGYTRNAAADNQKLIQESEARIREYEEGIANIRSVMQQSVSELQSVIKTCNDKKLEVQQVLEFFGQDTVARVVKESPKLHEPSAPGAGTASN